MRSRLDDSEKKPLGAACGTRSPLRSALGGLQCRQRSRQRCTEDGVMYEKERARRSRRSWDEFKMTCEMSCEISDQSERIRINRLTSLSPNLTFCESGLQNAATIWIYLSAPQKFLHALHALGMRKWLRTSHESDVSCTDTLPYPLSSIDLAIHRRISAPPAAAHPSRFAGDCPRIQILGLRFLLPGSGSQISSPSHATLSSMRRGAQLHEGSTGDTASPTALDWAHSILLAARKATRQCFLRTAPPPAVPDAGARKETHPRRNLTAYASPSPSSTRPRRRGIVPATYPPCHLPPSSTSTDFRADTSPPRAPYARSAPWPATPAPLPDASSPILCIASAPRHKSRATCSTPRAKHHPPASANANTLLAPFPNSSPPPATPPTRPAHYTPPPVAVRESDVRRARRRRCAKALQTSAARAPGRPDPARARRRERAALHVGWGVEHAHGTACRRRWGGKGRRCAASPRPAHDGGGGGCMGAGWDTDVGSALTPCAAHRASLFAVAGAVGEGKVRCGLLGKMGAQRIMLVLSEAAGSAEAHGAQRADAGCRSALSPRACTRRGVVGVAAEVEGGSTRSDEGRNVGSALASHASLQLLRALFPSEMVADALRRVSAGLVCTCGRQCGGRRRSMQILRRAGTGKRERAGSVYTPLTAPGAIGAGDPRWVLDWTSARGNRCRGARRSRGRIRRRCSASMEAARPGRGGGRRRGEQRLSQALLPFPGAGQVSSSRSRSRSGREAMRGACAPDMEYIASGSCTSSAARGRRVPPALLVPLQMGVVDLRWRPSAGTRRRRTSVEAALICGGVTLNAAPVWLARGVFAYASLGTSSHIRPRIAGPPAHGARGWRTVLTGAHWVFPFPGRVRMHFLESRQHPNVPTSIHTFVFYQKIGLDHPIECGTGPLKVPLEDRFGRADKIWQNLRTKKMRK
ncbi:hypothetical protein DFH09DRAFT_1284078 [Mycena vulgaris]|nr:hypothetical protein DFH09DRAFT_1284078 [Mycena vulgaris]